MKKYIMLLFISGLMACSAKIPYVDTYSGRADGSSVRRSSTVRVAICFDTADMDTLQSLADKECAKTSKTAVYDKTVLFSCSLTTPSTAYFDCR